MQPYRVWLFSDLIEKNKRVFKVPVYQRNYDWNNIQCERLYKDIMNAHYRDHKHFTGTIVYIVGVDGSSLNEVLIIDGQQRLTSTYILLKALLNAAKGKNIRVEVEIEEVMFNRNCDEKNKLKLKPIKTDDIQLHLLIDDKIDEMDRNSNIYKNYICFEELIKETLESGLEVNDILDGIKKLEMVEIVLDKTQGDEPQKIFESINSTGLELSLADQIRNYLLMDDEFQDQLYENYWAVIEKNVGYRNLGDFAINFLNSEISKIVNSKNAYRLFKEHCEELNISHECVLKKMKRMSKVYGAFIGENRKYSIDILDALTSFNTIKQTTVLPFIFKIVDDYEEGNIDKKTLLNILNYLLTYIIRMITCDLNKNLNKFMKSLYDRAFKGNYDEYYEMFVKFINAQRGNDRMPTDSEFKEALINKPIYKKSICKFILSAIENSSKEHIDISNLTIEHILPQKENAAVWKREVGNDYESVYEKYLHTLGNLTFTGHNSELGTKPFTEKKNIIQTHSKANILNKEVLSAKRWDRQAIEYRGNVLSNIVIDIFNYEDIHWVSDENEEMCFSIEENIDFANTKPKEFIYDGEHVKVSSWISLLTKFIQIAYSLDSEMFSDLAIRDYSIPNANRTYITNDVRKLRKAKQIDKSGIFFETNLSANSIVSFLKDLIKLMNQEASDFSVVLQEVSFDIADEETWKNEVLPVSRLFFNLIEDLIKQGKITENEIELLKTKEYTTKLFKTTDYPAIANNRFNNNEESSKAHYRNKTLFFNESSIYITIQLSEPDRYSVIEWYKNHLN